VVRDKKEKKGGKYKVNGMKNKKLEYGRYRNKRFK